MQERLFGMEIEYGCAVRERNPKRLGRGQDWVERLMAIARKRLPYLPSMEGSGIFLQNGARLYVDCSHPEMTTPECANPWDVVRYMQAGERILTQMAEEMTCDDPTLAEVLIFKTNVDQNGGDATWGCHTSFMHRASPGIFPAQIIPHLVSRIIYSGAGGVELADGRLRFTLSPRVRFLEREVSNSSTSERGIFHTKDETLAADGYHRLHIICGESPCSEAGLWVNIGATALIVALIDAGCQPGQEVRLKDPLAAMRRFSLDPTCRAVAQTQSGKRLTAVQIQRHYLEFAEANCRAPFMPPWSQEVCFQWRQILDRLEGGAPGSVLSTLDWAMKLGLFLDRAERRGFGAQCWHHAKPARQSNPQEDVADPKETAPDPAARLPSAKELLQLHQELCEIDVRFGQLGGNGIFATLNRAGVLAHHVSGVDNIEHALVHPPAIGRAGLRGKCVRRFAGQHHRYSCGWRHVLDREKNLLLDLSDPFTAEERWKPAPAGFSESATSMAEYLSRVISEAHTTHDRGDHEFAARLLGSVQRFQNSIEWVQHSEFLRLRAWIQSRRGFLDGIPALEELAQRQPLDLSLINTFVCCYRYQGLMPPPAIEAWIERGRQLLSPAPDPSDGAALPFLGHWGYYLLRNGRLEDALRTLQDACRPVRRRASNVGAIARTLADYGDAWRAVGQPARAAALLDEAQSLQRQHLLEGDFADFVLTHRAKLQTNPEQVLELLSQARALQTTHGNLMGEARTLLLEARLGHDPELAARHKTRVQELRGLRPALSQCRLLAKILNHWEAWTNNSPDPDGAQDAFWWL